MIFFGKAGIIGTAGKGERDLEATGVVSPGASARCFTDEGVVGFVECASSEASWLVEGVSGRGTAGSSVGGSTEAGSSEVGFLDVGF